MQQDMLEIQMFAYTAPRVPSYILHPVLMDFQQVAAVRDGEWRRHTHFKDFELIIPVEGRYDCALDDVEIHCGTGQFLLIQPGQVHQDHFRTGIRFLAFHFQLLNPEKSVYIDKIFSPAVTPKDQVMPLRDRGFADRVIELLFASGREGLPFPVSEGIFLSLFRLVTGAFPPESVLQSTDGDERNHRMLRQIMEVFTAHLLSGTLPPGTIERRLGVSSRTWHRISHELLGAAPRTAFERFRISSIHTFMLKHPELSVKEIAGRFNFADPFYFSRVFRRHFGYPPSALGDRKKTAF